MSDSCPAEFYTIQNTNSFTMCVCVSDTLCHSLTSEGTCTVLVQSVTMISDGNLIESKVVKSVPCLVIVLLCVCEAETCFNCVHGV